VVNEGHIVSNVNTTVQSRIFGCVAVTLDELFLTFQRHCCPPKHLELLAKQHSVRSRKTWIFSSTAVRTSDLTISQSRANHIIWVCWSPSLKFVYTEKVSSFHIVVSSFVGGMAVMTFQAGFIASKLPLWYVIFWSCFVCVIYFILNCVYIFVFNEGIGNFVFDGC